MVPTQLVKQRLKIDESTLLCPDGIVLGTAVTAAGGRFRRLGKLCFFIGCFGESEWESDNGSRGQLLSHIACQHLIAR